MTGVQTCALPILAVDKGVELAYIPDENIPETVIGDASRVRQILVNLISNAVKFTHKGEVVVSVSSRLVSQPGGSALPEQGLHELQFTVRDTGIGIPQDRMDRLFHSFSQVDSSTTRQYGGTGLGLAISKRLSELMGGRMWAESEVGVGSVFRFVIQAESAENESNAHERAPLPQLGGKRLLIVAGSETGRRVVTRQVRGWGMVPEIAVSGPEAVKKLSEGRFDVLVIDTDTLAENEIGVRGLATEINRLPLGEKPHLVRFSSGGAGKRDFGDNGALVFTASLTRPIKKSHFFDVLMGLFSDDGVQVKPKSAQALDTQLGKRLPMRILLAEDNVVNQRVAVRLLEKMGYRPDIAGNGLEVLDALRRQPYDLILMDVHMPEMDGIEASRLIGVLWAEERRPTIIALTANAMQEDRDECMAAGMDGYLSKPIRIVELQAVLEHWGDLRANQAGGEEFEMTIRSGAAETGAEPEPLVP